MKKIACVLLLLASGCDKPASPVASVPPDPVAPFRPACAARWQTTFAIEKCARDEMERAGTSAAAPAAAPAAATPAAARR